MFSALTLADVRAVIEAARSRAQDEQALSTYIGVSDGFQSLTEPQLQAQADAESFEVRPNATCGLS